MGAGEPFYRFTYKISYFVFFLQKYPDLKGCFFFFGGGGVLYRCSFMMIYFLNVVSAMFLIPLRVALKEITNVRRSKDRDSLRWGGVKKS